MSDPTWKTKNLIRTLDLCLKRVKILFGLSQLDKDCMFSTQGHDFSLDESI